MTLFHEWPLVFFTLVVQLAVGVHLALLGADALAQARPSKAQGPWGRKGTQCPSLAVGVLMAMALAVSLLHLGAPMSAVHALSNLERSWLSREILAVLVFLCLWGTGYGLGRRPGAPPWMVRVLSWVTGLAGIVLIGVMARIYMVPARPLWDHWLTAAGFLLTTLLLGAVAGAAHLERFFAAGTAAGAAPQDAASASDPDGSGPVSRAGPFLLAAGVAASLAQVGTTLAHPMTSQVATAAGGTSLAALRLVLLLLGVSLLLVPLVRSQAPGVQASRAWTPRPWAAGAFLLLSASEVVGRLLFYAVGPQLPF